MNNIIDTIISRAKENIKTIVLPEAMDERVLKAAELATKEKIANIVLVGDENKIINKAKEISVDLTGVNIENPVLSENYELYIKTLYELRKEKGMTLEKAHELVKDEIYFGVLMVKLGHADGLVCGAVHTTADTLRPALQIIKAKPGTKAVSAFFLMEIPNSDYEKEYIFSDCGLLPYPTQEELAQIAIDSNDTYKLLVDKQPKVAMLSFSTLGSAEGETIDKTKNALEIVKMLRKDILIDGELQLDAAIDSKVASSKAPKSKVAGQANVLIFPDLNAGNIGYKLVERFAKANAYGPITQGLAKPVNDLSRGCKIEDIVGVIAITSIQANAIGKN